MFKFSGANITARILFILGLISIFGLALYPDLELPKFRLLEERSDFVYHMVAFFSLTTSAVIALGRVLYVVVSMAVFAVVLELLQTFVPGRSVFLIDVVASLLGVLLSAAFSPLVVRLWRRSFETAPRHRP